MSTYNPLVFSTVNGITIFIHNSINKVQGYDIDMAKIRQMLTSSSSSEEEGVIETDVSSSSNEYESYNDTSSDC